MAPIHWRRQVLGLLQGLDLECLVDGSATITDAVDAGNRRWCKQDQPLQQALITSLPASLISSIASAQTTRDIWVIIQNMYANASPSRVLNLQKRLNQSYKHPNQPVSEFLHGVQALCEDLAKFGHPVSNPAFKLAVLMEFRRNSLNLPPPSASQRRNCTLKISLKF